MLCELINFVFKVIIGNFMTADKHGAKWTTQDEEHSVIFTIVTLKESVKFLLSKCFVFQQVIRIPMGSDYASFFAIMRAS